MKIEYDKEADALYIRFKKAKVYKTIEKGQDVIEDFDKSGVIVGVEILDYSKKVPLRERLQVSVGEKTSLIPVK